MANFVTTPNILWKIENFSSVDKKLSPVIKFMGQKFHLSFSQFMESGGAKFQLILEYQNVPQVSCQFNIDASILYGTSHYLLKSGKYNLMYCPCCVWSDFGVNITKTLGHIADITFLVKVFPSANSAAFKAKEFVEEPTRLSPCAVNLIEDLGNLFNNEKQSDFTLKCGNISYKLHKAILSARSEYFAAMFRNDMRENEENEGSIDNIEPNILEIVLRYMYTGEVSELSLDSVKKVYAAADRLLVESLKIKCYSLFISDFTTDTVEENKTDQSESDDQQPGTSEESNNSKERQILEDLFRSSEWRLFSQEFPHKAHAMCKPYLLQNE